MSPLLYNIYTDSLNVLLNNAEIGWELNGTKINSLSYADNLVLMSPSAAGLQSLIDMCDTFASDYDITFNESKSKCMVICPKVRNLPDELRVTLKSSPLLFVNFITYLGYVINNNLIDESDIKVHE